MAIKRPMGLMLSQVLCASPADKSSLIIGQISCTNLCFTGELLGYI